MINLELTEDEALDLKKALHNYTIDQDQILREWEINLPEDRFDEVEAFNKHKAYAASIYNIYTKLVQKNIE